MNTTLIGTLLKNRNFESRIKDDGDRGENIVSSEEKQGTKDEPPALHVLSEAAVKHTKVVVPTESAAAAATSSMKQSTRMVPLVYIQTSANMKVPPSITSAGNTKSNPQLVVNANTPFQLSALSTKLKSNSTLSSVVLTQTGANNKSQPIILQKTTNSANTLIPVSVATSTGTKQTFAYLGTIIKQPQQGGAKTTDSQIVVPTSHLPAGLVPAPTNQKLVLTPMTMPKLAPRLPVTNLTASNNQPKISNLILPMTLKSNNNSSVINFKISNGQIQSDAKGSITVLCDNKAPENNNEKDKPDREKSTTTNASPDNIVSDNNSSSKGDKLLSETTYELSIPDVPTSKCELSYTISIPEETGGKFFKQSFKEQSGEEDLGNVQSIVMSVPPKEVLYRKPLHEVSILKKCNLNALDRRVESANKNKTTNCKPVDPGATDDAKPEAVENDLVKLPANAETKPQLVPEVRKVNPERRRKSQYTYLRDYDEVVVTSGNAWENKNAKKYKQFQSAEITFTKLSSVDEDSKDAKDTKKSMDDFIEIELVKQDLPQFNTEVDQDIRTALKWKDGIGFLPGSKLKFHINEFGFIEMLVGDEYDKIKTVKKAEEAVAGEEILCCSECGCYGMPTEFVSRNYCSKTCKLSAIKVETKRAFMQEAKAKRKKKKLAMMQKHKSEELSPKMSADDMTASNMNLPHSDDDTTSNDMLQDNKAHNNYPWQCVKKGFSWSKYLDHVKGKAAPVKLFKDPFPYAKNGFRPGMKLEGIDPQHPSYFCVMSVVEVQGYRIRLHFDGYPADYEFWVNADSMDIFPVGFCEKFNHVLHPPPSYAADFNWTTYLKQCKATAAPRHLFANRAGNSICPNGFRLGMKLEAVDKKNTSLVCVATVTDQMDNRFLVHFDSWDDIYDYWADPSSPYIHPVGWCDQFDHNLTPPNDYPSPELFTWEKYLKETKSVAAPVRAFKQRPSNGFRRDMRLECVDRRAPALIRVATVEDVRDHQIKLRFDGWPNKYSYWIDDDSADIHPAGWCQKTGHPLESPLTPEDVYDSFECPTVGCRGVGHIRGAKFTVHSTSADCPYSDENLEAEFVLADRLTITDQDFTQESVVPVSREPRDALKPSRVGRPSKIRRLTETSVKCEWPTEDDLSDGSRKRKLSSREHMAVSPAFTDKSKLPDDLNCRFKSLVSNEYPTCPSQQVLAKHSKILNEIISSNSQDPRNWSQDEVAEFVNSLPSCREHSKLFVTHKIDGEAFLMLTQKDLVDILKFKLGPAIKLYNSIVLLRQNVSFYN